MTGALVVERISVRYGGRLAVADVSFVSKPGAVLGLIGPNGAGKTSVLNVCSGLIEPAAGRIVLDGADITGLAPAARARCGIGRTFQRPALFGSLTVFDNVMLGWEAGQAARNPIRHLMASRKAHGEGRNRAADSLRQCGIDHLAQRPAAEVTTGERRLVELARVVAGGFSVLLLDEPSSGLGQAEKEGFARVLLGLVDARRLTVVLVEHDMRLVTSVCDEVVVLDSGRLLHIGAPDELRHNDKVRLAYLGGSAS